MLWFIKLCFRAEVDAVLSTPPFRSIYLPRVYAQTSILATLGSWSETCSSYDTHVVRWTCSYFALSVKLGEMIMWSSCCAFMSNRYVYRSSSSILATASVSSELEIFTYSFSGSTKVNSLKSLAVIMRAFLSLLRIS